MNAFLRGQVVGLVAVGAIGCGVGSVKGSVNGKSLDVSDGVVMNGQQFLGAFGSPNAGVVVLTNTDKLCTNFSKGMPKDATGLALVFLQTGEGKKLAPIQAGEFKWHAGGIFAPDDANAKVMTAIWITTDGQCKKVDDDTLNATGGSVKLESIDMASGGTAAGTFTLTFGGDTLSGSFNVDQCESELPDNDKQVCE